MPDFEEVTITDDTVVPDGFPAANETRAESSDLACEVCGTPLVYRGTGRKPKRCDEHKNYRSSAPSSAGPRGGAGRGNASVEQAVSTLGNLYDLVAMMFLFADPDAAKLWQSNVPDLQTRNRAILSGDPELTKAINRMGVKGGKFAFAAVQISAVAPPAMVAAQTVRKRAAEREAQQRRESVRRNNSGTPGPRATGTDGPPNMGNRDFFG